MFQMQYKTLQLAIPCQESPCPREQDPRQQHPGQHELHGPAREDAEGSVLLPDPLQSTHLAQGLHGLQVEGLEGLAVADLIGQREILENGKKRSPLLDCSSTWK